MTYLLRSVKYFIRLCVLILVMSGILLATGWAAGSAADLWWILIHTPRGWILMGLIVGLSALYPRLGYTAMHLPGNMALDSVRIAEAFRACGYEPAGGDHHTRYFRVANPLQRLMQNDERIRITQQGPLIEVEGPRKALAKVGAQLQSHLERNDETKQQ